MFPLCDFCGLEVDPSRPGIFTRVVGWKEHRGGKGGANAIHLPSDPMGFAHAHCFDEYKLRIQKGWVGLEETLF